MATLYFCWRQNLRKVHVQLGLAYFRSLLPKYEDRSSFPFGAVFRLSLSFIMAQNRLSLIIRP